MRGILIGIAGGTGSGKSLVSQSILKALGSDKIVIIEQDAYYKDLAHLPPEERAKTNFDHPNSIDHELLYAHIRDLVAGKTIEQPLYDFACHTRRPETRRLGPHEIIILEGILILDSQQLRSLMDIKVFVDTDADIRLLRRIRRDVEERGRTVESVLDQYENSVRPMHLQFVEPSKRYADIIIPEGGRNTVAIDLLKTKIEAILREREEHRQQQPTR
ncbi:MAG TPA: uridine kinase [Bacteroidetes bacterium]|nr:uridine kinase [Bacteroidota bacterium]